ncbi:hypothetical protein BJV78DRAFT_1245296 [Lactifluus subvellereus]|nr:hypothetical protein BJV78DRAFT_1245296 [Lactifluus subvellereus]
MMSKYMTIRGLVPHANTKPSVPYGELNFRGHLPVDVIASIQNSDADTVLLGASCTTDTDIAQFRLHTEINIRNGRLGLVRVSPSDGRMIVLLDFSGNQLITSLSNNKATGDTPLASLTIIPFTTGDIVYVTRNTRRLIGGEARSIMPQQNVLTVYETTSAVVRDATPIRGRVRSLYSPLVKFLEEELQLSLPQLNDSAQVRPVGVHVHSVNLATFEWEFPPEHEGVYIQPGQAAVLDLSQFSDAPEYAQLALERPRAFHDDRIRTWTVSSAHSLTCSFEPTIRHKQGEFMSGTFFLISRHQHQQQQSAREDWCGVCGSFRAELMGFVGAFILLPPPPSRRALWAAGGVGVTRFLAMLGALSQAREAADVVLVLSTRDLEELYSHLCERRTGRPRRWSACAPRCVHDAAGASAGIDEMYCRGGDGYSWAVREEIYSGRITAAHWTTVSGVEEREVFVCGPGTFEGAIIESLRCVGAKSWDCTERLSSSDRSYQRPADIKVLRKYHGR